MNILYLNTTFQCGGAEKVTSQIFQGMRARGHEVYQIVSYDTRHSVLPEGVQCRIDGSSWTRPAIFEWLEEKGQIDSHEMYRVFNNGIGLVVIVSAEDADRAMEAFKAEGEKVFRIGEISTLPAGEAPCVVL